MHMIRVKVATLIAACAAIFGSTVAQVTIDSSDIVNWSGGTYGEPGWCGGSCELPTGPDVVWDLSAEPWVGWTLSEVLWRSPTADEQLGFAQGNLVEVRYPTSDDSARQSGVVYEVTAEHWQMLGGFTSLDDLTTKWSYMGVPIVLPMSYGKTLTLSDTVIGGTLWEFISLRADSYGSLVLPGGVQLSDLLGVRVINGTAGQVFFDYFWYSTHHGRVAWLSFSTDSIAYQTLDTLSILPLEQFPEPEMLVLMSEQSQGAIESAYTSRLATAATCNVVQNQVLLNGRALPKQFRRYDEPFGFVVSLRHSPAGATPSPELLVK